MQAAHSTPYVDKLLKRSEYVCPVLLTKFFNVVSEFSLTKEDRVRNTGLSVAFFAFTRLFFGTAYKYNETTNQ